MYVVGLPLKTCYRCFKLRPS